jgi:hypothetical protein
MIRGAPARIPDEATVDGAHRRRRIVLVTVPIPVGHTLTSGDARATTPGGIGFVMATRKAKRDEQREHRISMEIVVNAYGEHEQAMSWYYYLKDQLQFPFTATCTAERSISPLRIRDEVDVIGMPGEDECAHEMFVSMRWDRKSGLAVPLSQLKPIDDTDEQTKQAVGDWHDWVAMGYAF